MSRRSALPPSPKRAELAEDEFAGFFAQSLDLLCIAGLDGYFKRLNPAWETCLGWKREELMARRFLDFVQWLDAYIATLDDKTRPRVREDLAAFRRFYFDHVDDPERLARLEEFVQ